MGDYVITDNKERKALLTALEALSNTDKTSMLWSYLHRYGYNYIPSDTSNAGWTAAGLYISYFNGKGTDYGMPATLGQLINIPPTESEVNENMQIFICQPTGGIWKRGANGNNVLSNTAWDSIALNNLHNIEDQFTLSPSHRISVTALDGEYNGVNIQRSYIAPCNGYFTGFMYGTDYTLNAYLDEVCIAGLRAHYGNNTANIFFPVRAGQSITYKTSEDNKTIAYAYNSFLFPYYWQY